MIRKSWAVLALGSTVALYGGVSIAYPPAYDYLAPRWARLLLKILRIKLHIHGLEYLKGNTPAIFVMNHESALDPVAVMAALPVRHRSLAKKELFNLPILGWIMTLVRHIPVDRQNPRRAVDVINRITHEVIQRKISLVVSPEGTRSRDGQLGQFKKGAFRLAERYNLPLIPITILGAGECLPTKTLELRPGIIEVYLGQPIHLSDFPSMTDCIEYIRQKMIAAKAHHLARKGEKDV